MCGFCLSKPDDLNAITYSLSGTNLHSGFDKQKPLR